MLPKAVFLLALLSVLPRLYGADIHQWRDANGRVVFGDRPPQGIESTVRKVKPNVYTSPKVVAGPAAMAAGGAVVMYSTAWCGYCKKARRYFQSHNIAFSEYDVETSDKGRLDYERLGAHGVPVILVGQQRMNGFSEAAFASLYAARR